LLAVLQNPEIAADADSLRQQLALASSQLRNGQDRSDFDSSANAVRDRTRLQQELAVAEKRVAALEIRAAIDGVVATSGLEQKPGAFLAAGDEFARVVDRSTMKARILVRDWDLQDVQQGATVRVKVVPFPYRTYSGKVGRIYPASAVDRPVNQTENLERLGQQLTNYFAVDMEFVNSDGSLREGMTGTAKVSGKRASLAWQASRAIWRWARSQAW
jgi:multidrug resistance efflux pump